VIISGPKDLYVIHPWSDTAADTALNIEMGKGTNRVFSGDGNDAFSLILDESLDITYDKGGENLLAVTLPEGLTFCDVGLDFYEDEYILYRGREKKTAVKCLHYIFYADPQSADNKVQMLFRETTGREVRLHMIAQFRFHGSSGLAPDIERLLYFLSGGSIAVAI